MIKILINEARSKNAWRNKISNQFAEFLLNFFKRNPEQILRDSLVFRSDRFANKIDNEFIQKINEVSVTIEKIDGLSDNEGVLIRLIGARYFPSNNSSREYGGVSYTFNKGDINLEIEIDSQVQSFNDLEKYYKYFHGAVADLFYHESFHLTQDFTRGLANIEDKSPYRFLTDKQKEDFNYLMDRDETEAYVGQAMKIVKRLAHSRGNKISFIKVLDSIINGASDFQTFFQSKADAEEEGNEEKAEKITDLINMIKYKYLDHGTRIYHSLKKDPKISAKLKELGSDLQEKGLYVALEQGSDFSEEEDYLQESKIKLSKYWQERAKKRARRAKRRPNNSIDKEWAKEQQNKSKDITTILNKKYEKEIKETEEKMKEIEEVLSVAAAKKQDAFLNKSFGRASGFKKNAKKHKGQGAVARGERFGPFGPSALEETNEN